MFFQNAAGERLNFAERHGFKAARPFQAEREAADAAKKIKDA